MYSHTFLSKDELEHILQYKIDPLELNRIISAYDMADWAYGDKKTLDGSMYFFHVTRVCKILINELGINDPEMLISALLHDVYKKVEDITPEIIIYNFGPYIAYLMEILQHDLKYIKSKPFTFGVNEIVRIPVDDYLILWLSEHLDNFRCLEITPNFSPVNYILNITQTLIAQSKNNDNEAIKYLITELKKERNKILG
jgi:(p)ppGpp synthase/HD superfamily hydrolase